MAQNIHGNVFVYPTDGCWEEKMEEEAKEEMRR